MSHNSMAAASSSSAVATPPPVFSYDDDKLDLESVCAFVAVINQHITEFLEDTKSRKCLKLKCSSKLDVCNRGYLEFSEQSILSNLYWGIESIEAAIQAKWTAEKTSRLQNSENMLQVPASLDEQGETAGIPNNYLIGYSYFYLSLVRKLQGDEWQVAMHFLQALVVSPRLLYTEIATDLELRSGVAEIPKNSTTKCLKDILLDSEPETPIYVDFSDSGYKHKVSSFSF